MSTFLLALEKLGLTEDDAKMMGMGAMQGLSQGIQSINNSKMQDILSEYAIQSDRRRAQNERNSLSKTKQSVNAAALTRSMSTQVSAMQAEGTMQVSAAASGMQGTSMDDISASMELAKNSQLQQITTDTEAIRQNIGRQQQTIDTEMARAEVMHQGNKDMRKRNRKFSAFNSIVQSGMSGFNQSQALGFGT